MSHSSSDEGDFLGLEERMSFDEDVSLQEPLNQEELHGAQGGQEVARHVSQPEIPEADPWTFFRPMGMVDVRLVPQDYDHVFDPEMDQFRRMTAAEITA